MCESEDENKQMTIPSQDYLSFYRVYLKLTFQLEYKTDVLSLI